MLLSVTALLAIAVLSTAGALAWSGRQSLLAQTEADGILLARLLARSAQFAGEVTGDVEQALGDQMLVEATIAAHLVAVAEAAGLPSEAINARLREIVARTSLSEFWITDEQGHAYLRTEPDIDFTFSPDPVEQPQAHVFWPLLTGQQSSVVQEARVREVDSHIFKYVGVGGVDKPRIVQVGHDAVFLDQLRDKVGLSRLIDELVSGGNVVAIRVLDPQLLTLAFSAVPGVDLSSGLGPTEIARLEEVVRSGRSASYLEGSVLTVMAPIADLEDRRIGAALVMLPTDHVRAALEHELWLAALVACLILAVGVLASILMSRRVTGPVARLTAAAAAVEAETIDLEVLAPVARRSDELGQLARVFARMAREVYAREERLKLQVRELRIEIDEVKRARQVAEITDTDYFRQLQGRAREMRRRAPRRAESADQPEQPEAASAEQQTEPEAAPERQPVEPGAVPPPTNG
jgi:HAMP domain-containing protein